MDQKELVERFLIRKMDCKQNFTEPIRIQSNCTIVDFSGKIEIFFRIYRIIDIYFLIKNEVNCVLSCRAL